MKAASLFNFISQFNVQLALNPELIFEKNGRFFLINDFLKPLANRDFFYAGTYLGKAKAGKFFPSFILLSLLAKEGQANRIVIDRKSAWLFICGRDVLRKSIVRIHGQAKKGGNTLVLNEFGECLGFGRILGKVTGLTLGNEIAIRNVSDIGDFLRRER
jgi:ribosome biogenesis protein Nip4